MAKYKLVKIADLEKKKIQFSKKVCIFGLVLVSLVTVAVFILAWYEKQIPSDFAIAVLTAFGGFATGGYYALAGVRDCNLNKYGITKKEVETDES